jgi:hypothetical protein
MPPMKRCPLFYILCYLFVASALYGQMGITAGGTTRKFATPPGGPGSSYAKAIPIHAPDWNSGIKTEYNYVQKHFPNAKAVNHGREWYTNKTYDVITLTMPDGTKRVLYFRYWKHS